ncbi:Cys-Gln thioester bond-forming surface protein [Streptomyces sp. NPDC020875]|uniref:Cys-Gln thioester bond-forming surface protein n=1 Tax=Streptomyces sp. NPDC020875 TaxID=3154898 RepID=UPI0033CAE226
MFALFSASSASSGRGRSTVRRIAAVTAVTGLVATGALTGAGAAVASDGVSHTGGAVATLAGLKVHDYALLHTPGDKEPFRMAAGLFELTGGGTFKTYCIDLHNPTEDGTKYQETPWDQSVLNKNPEAGKIRWILQNSYPKVDDLAALAEAAKSGPLTEKTAAAGTQVAIWRYSDKADVTAADENAGKLADYLYEKAQNLAEPKPSLKVDPHAVSGKPGSRIGPVTVTTDAPPAAKVGLTLSSEGTVAGVKIVDKAGKPVTTAVNGDKVYFEVPADAPDGRAELTASVTTQVPVGRAFAPQVGTSQTMILAGSSTSEVFASAAVVWAKTGPVPAVTFQENCDKGGVDVTAANKGDAPFTFTLAGKEYTVPAGGSKTVTVPVAEDQPYDITITGPNDFKETFKGVLDCETSGKPVEPKPSSEPTPNSAGGTGTGGGDASTGSTGGSTGTTGAATTTGGGLAATGGSSATPVIAGVAVALVALGGGAVFFLRKKKAAAGE